MVPHAGLKPLILELLAFEALIRQTAIAKIKFQGCPVMPVRFSQIATKNCQSATSHFWSISWSKESAPVLDR
jgi:hypothetical protein